MAAAEKIVAHRILRSSLDPPDEALEARAVVLEIHTLATPDHGSVDLTAGRALLLGAHSVAHDG
jgi:hypothetical protein